MQLTLCNQEHDWRITLDQVCDFIPVLSTVAYVVNVVQLRQFQNCSIKELIILGKDRYYEHLTHKQLNHPRFIAVPFLNIFFAIYNRVRALATTDRTWNAIKPRLKELVTVSAKETKIEDPLQWIFSLSEKNLIFSI